MTVRANLQSTYACRQRNSVGGLAAEGGVDSVIRNENRRWGNLGVRERNFPGRGGHVFIVVRALLPDPRHASVVTLICLATDSYCVTSVLVPADAQSLRPRKHRTEAGRKVGILSWWCGGACARAPRDQSITD